MKDKKIKQIIHLTRYILKNIKDYSGVRRVIEIIKLIDNTNIRLAILDIVREHILHT